MMIPTFLKWAGGKRRLIEQIDPWIVGLTHGKIKNYFEPFLGGAYMFFYIKQKYNPENCVLSDINLDLINSFKDVRDKPKELMHHLKNLKRLNSETHYYKIRKYFNQNKVQGVKRSAVFIYLNKTCYNGLYRVNSKGEFNVPYGRHKDPEIFNKETILFASKLLKGVKIMHQDYRKIINHVKKGDFVYLDPCYDPLKRTSFANYTPKRFSDEDRVELSKFMYLLKKEGVKVILSNNNLNVIRQIYFKFKIIEILASRSINSNALERGKIKELLIMS